LSSDCEELVGGTHRRL